MRSFVKSRISLLLVGLICMGIATGIVHAQVTVVACVGDSNTYGYGLNLARGEDYPARMEEKLRDIHGRWVVHNFGVNGNTVLRQGARPYSTTRALAVNPDIVIFAFGVNATRNGSRHLIDEHYVSDYVDLIGEFSQLNPVPEMWICLPLAAQSTSFSVSPEILEDKVVPYIHDVAAITGLPIIDLFSVFKAAPELYQGDGIHPTNAGSALIAEMVATTLLGMRWFPDFNDDLTVNIEDLINLIEAWGRNEPGLDIAPPPFGDGIVDVQDLEVVMRYWGQNATDATLIAHWKLDESAGDIAYDSVSRDDGRVIGNPLWQPLGGAVDGALQFDGEGDYIRTPFVLNPEEGPFSVIAWIQGGGPGEVILSLATSSNWLGTDAQNGTLQTTSRSRFSTTLGSQVVVTDGDWHHVGLVWNGSDRILYVDDVEAARDSLSFWAGRRSSLYLGADEDLDPGSFWSGMIDDVRIYNRAVKP